ncbi:hypothetical protein HBA55_29935 [Pseudomaricurvus alkylphenolicus]|uniref:hypothetical protein n=1 Tax=Pseudomaricurvus alkylphenolicus TaxID=1306991 RepID=UPI0014218CF4|nr:hypothetical protein [Pseudomaricurvus alkylphenolicus]NIB43861.1 hypothetical protein [Pseudomaricurvus alkylphenolicus]
MSVCNQVQDPEVYLSQCRATLSGSETASACLSFDFAQYYLPDTPSIRLIALVEYTADRVSRLLLARYSPEVEHQFCAQDFDFEELAQGLALPCFDLDRALPLTPIHIAKPWGQEIWFTGVEERGQSLIGDGKHSIPLPWLLALLPQQLSNRRERALNLLKILDPLPEAVFGDLYFELHQEKQEVYVVTSVDSTAWPEGSGGIRLGFDSERLAQYPDRDAFVSAFGTAVKDYEAIRRNIDNQIDSFRLEEGIGLREPVSAEQQKVWLNRIDSRLRRQEEQARQAMDDFKATLPLRVGDVVKVPCFTPHSLLHGVRTIEFQTPVYERQIVSFAQKVLTQDHWDTDSALACMNLVPSTPEPLPVVHCEAGVSVQEVVRFSDFLVRRITLQPGAHYQLPSAPGYLLAIGLIGTTVVCDTELGGEMAALIGADLTSVQLQNSGDEESIILISNPVES